MELNVQPDHVHLVVSIPPKYAVSEFMGYLKGKMAIRWFQQYESLGRRYWGRHLWARGYCVSTIGLDEEKIRKYVQWQEKQEKQTEAVQGKLFNEASILKARAFQAHCSKATAFGGGSLLARVDSRQTCLHPPELGGVIWSDYNRNAGVGRVVTSAHILISCNP